MQMDASVIESGHEWATACAVQQRFMQHVAPECGPFDYSARCRQAQQLGGDCYDFARLDDQRLAVTVGDASGKGFAAALMISNVQSSLRTAALFTGDDLAALLGIVNRQVYASSLADRYATLFYGVFDGSAGMLRYVNAGHYPPVVLRRDGSIEWLETGGAPVGMFADWTYQEGSVQLEAGDLFLAYTDGVAEAVNSSGEEWGVEGVLKAADAMHRRRAKDVVSAMFQSLDEFSDGTQNDDATIAAVRLAWR
jgi:sigma-B regulation protein RsbU (phosphoserine phosphatase)